MAGESFLKATPQVVDLIERTVRDYLARYQNPQDNRQRHTQRTSPVYKVRPDEWHPYGTKKPVTLFGGPGGSESDAWSVEAYNYHGAVREGEIVHAIKVRNGEYELQPGPPIILGVTDAEWAVPNCWNCPTKCPVTVYLPEFVTDTGGSTDYEGDEQPIVCDGDNVDDALCIEATEIKVCGLRYDPTGAAWDQFSLVHLQHWMSGFYLAEYISCGAINDLCPSYSGSSFSCPSEFDES